MNSADVPIYEQIKNQIKAAILAGELEEGDVLPSVRNLARDLNCSVITTRKAYEGLEAEGFTINMAGVFCGAAEYGAFAGNPACGN